MIIIPTKTTENMVYFPRNIYNLGGEDYKLVLVDRGTNVEYDFDVIDLHQANYGYYSFVLDLSKLPNDEYEYTIYTSDNDRVSKGIIRLGDLIQNHIVYDKDNQYIIYDKDN